MDKGKIIVGSIVGFGVLALGVMMALLAPLLYAIGGYITGWVLASLFPFAGRWVVAGADSLGVIGINQGMLPTIGAFLGFVGSFFKATQTNKNESK